MNLAYPHDVAILILRLAGIHIELGEVFALKCVDDTVVGALGCILRREAPNVPLRLSLWSAFVKLGEYPRPSVEDAQATSMMEGVFQVLQQLQLVDSG
ncbi:hypothetical protein FQZ97_433460 [compost metagenome]